MKHRRVAFSLLEVLLAVATLTVALLLVVALGISVMGRAEKAHDVPVGTIAAENILNQLIYDVNADTANRVAWFAMPTTPAWKVGTYQVNHIDFAYTVDFESLPVGTATGMAENHLVKLSIQVNWTKGRGPNNGQQSSSLVRLLHE